MEIFQAVFVELDTLEMVLVIVKVKRDENNLLSVKFCSTDVDECELSFCSANANCTNTEGSYMCQCQIGFSGDGYICSGKDKKQYY